MSEPSIDSSSASATSNVVHVNFRGDPLDVIRDQRGVWVPIKRVCEVLGLDTQAQQRRLGRHRWAVTAIMAATGPDRKTYQTACLHLDALPMWLATIETARVAEGVREKLELYQCECAKVLRDAVLGNEAQGARSEGAVTLQVRFEAVREALHHQNDRLRAALGVQPGEKDSGRIMAQLLEELLFVQLAVAAGPLEPAASKAAATTIAGLRRRIAVASSIGC